MASPKFSTSEIKNGLRSMEERLSMAILMLGKTQATALESHMKESRKWTDRTSDAKNRLKGSCDNTITGVRITLAHGVDYGLWLELANEKRYAVIEPTIRLKGSDVISSFEGLLNKLR